MNVYKIFLIFLLIIFFSFISLDYSQAFNLKNAFQKSNGSDPLSKVANTAGYDINKTDNNALSFISIGINVLLSILGIIFIALMIYGGYLWMTAMGREQQVTKAKDLITEAVVGLIIIVAAYAISYFVTKFLIEPYAPGDRQNQEPTIPPGSYNSSNPAPNTYDYNRNPNR